MRHKKREYVRMILLQIECHAEITAAEFSITLDAGRIETDNSLSSSFREKVIAHVVC